MEQVQVVPDAESAKPIATAAAANGDANNAGPSVDASVAAAVVEDHEEVDDWEQLLDD